MNAKLTACSRSSQNIKINGLRLGMTSLEFETEDMRPVHAECADGAVHVTLADGRTISAPLWWYPFLSSLDQDGLNEIELMYEGIWWTRVDEGISVKSMFLGEKARGAIAPGKAA